MGKLLTQLILFGWVAHADPSPGDIQYYRDLTLKIRSSAQFKIPMPSHGDMVYDYSIELGDPIYSQPKVSDVPVGMGNSDKFFRSFWDRIWLQDGSYATIGGEQIPLTCIFVSGQDNRYTGKDSPLKPQFIVRIYLVANDFTCQGPIKPGWPKTGGKKENWDTYVYYEVRDPTIMLPVDTHLRYRWSEFDSVFVK